jgi:hypothetical protein
MSAAPIRRVGGQGEAAPTPNDLDAMIRGQGVLGGTTKATGPIDPDASRTLFPSGPSMLLKSYDRVFKCPLKSPQDAASAEMSADFLSHLMRKASSGEDAGMIDIRMMGQRDKSIEDAICKRVKWHFQMAAGKNDRNALITGAICMAAAAAYVIPTVASMFYGYETPVALLPAVIGSGFAIVPAGYIAQEFHRKGRMMEAMSGVELSFSSAESGPKMGVTDQQA